MRKFMIMLTGIAVVGLLAACAPTKVSSSDRPETSFAPPTVSETPLDRTPVPGLPTEDMMFVFRGNEDATKLERVEVFVDEMTEDAILEKLIQFGVLDEGTEILSFEIEGDMPIGPGAPEGATGGSERIGTLNLSQVPASGTADETMFLGAIGNTFIENYELDKLKLLVNGANYESGNVSQGDEDYLEYVTEYVNVQDDSEEEE